MILALYSLTLWLAQPLLRRKLARRAQAEPGYAVAVPERFGRYSVPPEPSDAPAGPAGHQGLIWIHAVSLGETRAAAIVLAELRRQLPGVRLLLTHGTATGRAEGAKLLRAGDLQVWQPWDTPGAVRRFLDHFQPRIGILMETELWPNLTAECSDRGIPLTLVNARMSSRSMARARRLHWLSRPAYAALAQVWAQTEDDAVRLRALGASVSGVFGNLKFDATPDAAQCARGRTWRASGMRPVMLFASSREGEESALLDCLFPVAGTADHPPEAPGAGAVSGTAQLLIVPRHPQRFDEVAALIESRGLTVSRRSAWGECGPQPADVWLGDSLGEMALYYSLADVALLGGSFAPLGGQNLIEAAACGCPTVMGPHTFNFAEAAELAQAGGAALRVANLAQAVEVAQALVSDHGRHAAAVAAASQFAMAHRGACARTVAAVVALVS